MRALFSFSFAINGTVFDLKALPMCDESAVEVKRVTAYKDAVTDTVSGTKPAAEPKATVADAQVKRATVSSLTGEVLEASQMVKGVWRGEQFIEISDDDLAALRMSNGEYRVVGVGVGLEYTPKGSTMFVVPSKSTKEAHQRFVRLVKTATATELLIEGCSRGRQRLYLMTAHAGVLTLDEVAYKDETQFFEYPEDVEVETRDAEEIDLTSVPALDEVPHSSFIAAFNEKYGVPNA